MQAQALTDRAGLGISLMLLAWLLFSVVDTSVKWLVLLGLPATQLAFMRYFGHFLISLAKISAVKDERRFAIAHPWLVTIRALLLVSASTMNFYVLNFLPLMLTAAVMFSAPILVCFLSWPILGERVGPWRIFAICLGFGGVLVVLRPFEADFQWIALGTVYNATALAFFSVITRKLAGKESVETQQFYMGLIGSVTLAPFAYMAWDNPGDSLTWTLFLALGVWAWAGHDLLVRAHGMAPANLLMPFTYSFMIYLTISSYLVFNTLPDKWTIVGSIIIVVSGLIIWWREKQR